MTGEQLVICRGGPAQYDGTTAYVVLAEQPQLWFKADAVYTQTDRTEDTPHGLAIVFEYTAEDIPSA